MSLTNDQKKAAYTEGSVAVVAGAGAGKTYMLMERYWRHLDTHGLNPLQIVAVTFTEKAAAELRSRIRRHVMSHLPGDMEILAQLESSQISTIHSLAARICHEHAEEAGVPPDFQIMDPVQSSVWFQEQIAEVIEILPIDFFEKIPYSLAMPLFNTAMQNPLLVEQALARDPGEIRARLEEMRKQEHQEILHDPRWQEFKTALLMLRGADHDLLETGRRNVLAAMKVFETRPDALQDLLKSFPRSNGGAKGNWNAEELNHCRTLLSELKQWMIVVQKENTFHIPEGPADIRLYESLPLMAEGCRRVLEELSQRKRRQRVLEFNDLEVHALRALESPAVREYYHRRWKAFLVDEFQDTNPVQGDIIRVLSDGERLTIVGDYKQSIYGFRGADVQVFENFQRWITDWGGARVVLQQSFRAHRSLLEKMNQICELMLGTHHQPLEGDRKEPHSEPWIRAYFIQAEKGVNKPERQQAEACLIARLIAEMLAGGMLVHDRRENLLRPVVPGDIAILSRTWGPLELYSDTLNAENIPAAVAAGGNLFQTREALDAITLLQFLAEPHENLALAALLRSPFFAVSDKVLYRLVNEDLSSLPKDFTWWTALQQTQLPELQRPCQILFELQQYKIKLSPSRLLQQADKLTGYSAVIGNLPGANRRLADWKGFLHWVRTLERGSADVFSVYRRLKSLLEAEVELPRPPLQAGDAVSLMSIHAAKGLEWPVVIIPNLDGIPPQSSEPVLYAPELGLAARWIDEEEELSCPIFYEYLKQWKKVRQEEESRRLFYVAMTRARDHLILTATEFDEKAFALFQSGLVQAKVEWQPVEFKPEDATPRVPPLPPIDRSVYDRLDLPIGEGLIDLPVRSLGEYAQCPKRFHLRFVENHPGLGEGGTIAAQIGSLTHLALEHGIDDAEILMRYDPALSKAKVEEALNYARSFRNANEFRAFRVADVQKEYRITHTVGSIRFNGVIDLKGPDWVLDYKTDTIMEPNHHLHQLTVYAIEMGVSKAFIAYLKHSALHEFSSQNINEAYEEIHRLVQQIESGEFPAHPTENNCRHCPYSNGKICGHAFDEIL